MKAPSVVLSLIVIVMAPPAFAQNGPGGLPGRPSSLLQNSGDTGSDKTDAKVFPANAPLPEPTEAKDIKPATLVLPDDPIEPYLLTKDNGPFMVTAKTFKGPDAARH